MNVKNINELDKNKLTIVCTTNQKYIKYVRPFLNSIEKNSRDLNVVLRLVNCENYDFEYINFDLYKIYQTKKFKNKFITTSGDPKNDPKTKNYLSLLKSTKLSGSTLPLFKRCESVYCSNIKFNTINKLLANNFKYILYLDVDTIVNGNFNSIIDDTKDYDLGMFIDTDDINCFTTKHGEEYMGWNAGLMYINNTKVSKNFYNILEKRVNADIFDIEADEVEFQKLLSEIDINIFYVDKKYKDNGPVYNRDSYMWSGQFDEKIINKMYLQELEKYNEA
tara:strand:+ start:5147 stop:5980 length:834 start_codon:yes stop_codon:yes gene_type:complete